MKLRILIIEDNAENMALLVYLLQSAGHTVFQASDGEAGLEVVGRETLDLVLCDIRMPGIDGYEVARRMRAEPSLRVLPLVAVTASVSGADRETALSAGFDDFVAKPIDPARFLEQVQGFIDGRFQRTGSPPCPESL